MRCPSIKPAKRASKQLQPETRDWEHCPHEPPSELPLLELDWAGKPNLCHSSWGENTTPAVFSRVCALDSVQEKKIQSVWEGSASSGSNNNGWKVLGKRIPESSKKQNSHLPHTDNCLHSIDNVFYEYPRGDLKCTGGLRRLYANTTLFYIKDLSICEFGGRGVLEPIPSGYPGTTVTEAKLNKAWSRWSSYYGNCQHQPHGGLLVFPLLSLNRLKSPGPGNIFPSDIRKRPYELKWAFMSTTFILGLTKRTDTAKPTFRLKDIKKAATNWKQGIKHKGGSQAV